MAELYLFECDVCIGKGQTSACTLEIEAEGLTLKTPTECPWVWDAPTWKLIGKESVTSDTPKD